MLNHVFETLIDTIWNSVSVPYKLEFVFSFVLGAAILEQVVDLVSYNKEEPVWGGSILFGYEVAY
jgi:hypothetical protein